ncbi:MAG: glycosyltransferase, partial [Clostridia bacterium]|nr:glycosyltransferase [Clostridia bacterium]
MNKKVTGCIVTYNNIGTIGAAVSTLLKNTACDFTLYIVDNGSTDGTVEFVRDNFPQVKLIISSSNIGFGAGHNS